MTENDVPKDDGVTDVPDLPSEQEILENEKKYRDFYQNVRTKINKWVLSGRIDKKSGKWTDHFLQYLLLLPDIVHLMIKLFMDKKVPRHTKGYILMAFAYLLSPIDIIPDFIPVAGFVDDLIIMVIALNKIINDSSPRHLEVIKSHWAGKEDIIVKVKEITAVMNRVSGQLPKSIFSFLKDKGQKK